MSFVDRRVGLVTIKTMPIWVVSVMMHGRPAAIEISVLMRKLSNSAVEYFNSMILSFTMETAVILEAMQSRIGEMMHQQLNHQTLRQVVVEITGLARAIPLRLIPHCVVD